MNLKKSEKTKFSFTKSKLGDQIAKVEIKKPEELKEKIEKGEEEGHPTWEELIDWERLQERVVEIEKCLSHRLFFLP